MPPLKKIAPANISLTSFPYPIDLANLKDAERYFVGNLDFKELLSALLANKKIMLIFSTKPKLDIAKNILFEIGIKNIGYAREEQTISAELFQQFLNKEDFNQFELYFILKYCSHLFLGYGVLDLNSKGDYMVYNFIKDERQVVKYPVVLTTHHGLYSILEKEAHVYADFDIVFFDLEWRYRNYNAYLSRTCDLYYIQNFIDMLLYKYTSLHKEGAEGGGFKTLQEFDTFFTMFLGILRTDTKKLFIGRAEDELQINPIVSHSDFYQTNLVLPKFKAFREKLKAVLHETDFTTLWKQIEHFFDITETIAKVQRKMFGQTGTDFYFLFSEEAKYTNREEFKDIFQKNHIVFFSDHEKQYQQVVQPTLSSSEELTPKPKLPHISTL
ncbi:MAG: hypothetical protein LBD11_06560 [Candidatus Peribacteria bacterium]|nr:hypothetical protein [Candidatus Peribacteria bacterium]